LQISLTIYPLKNAFMKRSRKVNAKTLGWKSVVLGLAATLLLCAVPAAAVEVYFNDFEGAPPYPEWSLGTQATTPSGRHFLGSNTTYGFGNEITVLTLTGLPLHSAVTVSFDLYIIQSWDGNVSPGPDFWQLNVGGPPVLLDTTFGIAQGPQSYPGDYPDSYPARTGAVENNTLGYPFYGDSVYHLTFTFPNTIPEKTTLVLDFLASGLQNIEDESWGLDNVRVSVEPTVIPLPSTLLLLGSGLVGLARWKRRG